jgi:hypothetical protein
MHNLSLMQNKIMFSVALLAIVASMSFMTIGSSTIVATAQQTTSTMEHSEGQTNATIVRDSTAFLLSGEIIPAESFIHLYDSTPDAIALGHLAAKIPCDENSNSTLTILTGSAPDFQPAELELIQNLSTPGELCLYHADLASEQGGNMTTDIAIQNPSEEDVELPATSTVVIGVNNVLPGAAEEHETEEAVATAGNSTQ